MTLPIFVINLPRATDRREKISRALTELAGRFEIVEAVDGATLPPADYEHRLRQDLARSRRRRELSAGEIGCFLSHYNLWARMVEENIPHALILEDDAVLDIDTLVVANVLPMAGWDWDVVSLAYPNPKTRKESGHRRRRKTLCDLTPGGGA